MLNRSQLRLRPTGGYNTRGATLYSKNGKKLSSLDIESISCSSCKLVLRNPVQLISCGDRFCRICLESISSCPVDGNTIDPQEVRDDKGCQKELRSLESSCTMEMNGCTWRGPLLEIEDHLTICTFAVEICSKCAQSIPKSKMDIHKSEECPKMEIKCAFQGCDATMLLSQSGDHYSQHMHKMAVTLSNTLAMVEKLAVENSQLRDDHNKMKEEILLLKSCGNYKTRTASDLQILKKPSSSLREVEVDGDEDELPQVKTSPVSLLSDQYNCGSSLMSSSSSGYGSLDVSESQIKARFDCIPMLEELTKEVKRQASQLVGCIESVQMVQEAVTRHAVAMEDVKLRQDILDVKTTTGVFIWKIPNVAKRHRDAVERRTLSLYSPPFQTSPHGYRMCIRMYLNGDGSGKTTHISVFLVLMHSEQDNLLRWPFVQPVTFTLLNQAFPSRNISETFLPDARSPSFQQPQSEMNIASGFPRFASQSILRDDSFTKGNAIFLRCQIDTQGLTTY